MAHDNELALGTRMKAYENNDRTFLKKKVPVIIRVDGRAFHTFLKPYQSREKPFNQLVTNCMFLASLETMKQIQGCIVSYTQSDEASFLLLDNKSIETQPYFGYEVPKLVSIVASTFSVNFYRFLNPDELPIFDARAFNVPEEEMSNYFLWRVRDAHRNAVQKFGQNILSPSEMHGVNNTDLIEKLKGIGRDFNQEVSNEHMYGMFQIMTNGSYSSPRITDKTFSVVDDIIMGAYNKYRGKKSNIVSK